MSATMNGCEMVWLRPIGNAVSSYARCASASSMKMCLGTLPMTLNTCSDSMPRSRSRFTRRSRVRCEVMPMPSRSNSAIAGIPRSHDKLPQLVQHAGRIAAAAQCKLEPQGVLILLPMPRHICW